MAFDLSNTLVVGISATALFDMSESDQMFKAGLEADPESVIDSKPPAQPLLLYGCPQRQQLIQSAIRLGWQLLQRVFHPHIWLDTVQFGCRQQTLDRRRTPRLTYQLLADSSFPA